MPTHPARLDPDALLAQCRLEQTRTTGPGGQRKNKVATAIRLTHEPTGATVLAGERRHQAENRKAALSRLRLQLALNVRTPATDAPTDLWLSRCRAGRLAISPSHEDFPALLAEALDVVAAEAGDVPHAADRLKISTSQLLKLLRHEPAALAQVNQARQARGLHALK